MQFFVGKLSVVPVHAAINAERRITAAGRSLRCTCGNCASTVAARWETRRELRKLKSAALAKIARHQQFDA
jgi:hypothetical protein